MSDCHDHDIIPWGNHQWGGSGTGVAKTCRYCGEKGLQWDKTPDGWRLFDSKAVIHSCYGIKANKTRNAISYADANKNFDPSEGFFGR